MFKILSLSVLVVGSLFSKEIDIDLNKAIKIALENNAINRISKLNLEIANAQYQQALSANYPSLDAIIYANRKDQDIIFQQRGTFTLASDFTKTLSLANTIGMNASDIPAPLQAGGITTVEAYQSFLANSPASNFPTGSISANLDSTAYGRDTIVGKIKLNYPLYTGGKVSAIIEQAKLNKDLKKQDIVRDRTSVIYDVKRYFYGYVLTNELYKLVNGIYKNFEFSRDLTKEFLENGTDLKIKRTDYLNIKLLTSLTQSTLSTIKLNKEMIKSALANSLGLKHSDVLKINYDEHEILKQNKTLQDLVKSASSLNPDINSINLALKIKDEQINEANSEYLPMINIFGDVSHTYNSYEYGYLNEDDENRWNIGLVVKMSIFNGFKTKNHVLEKKLQKKIVNEQKVLLEEAIALQLKNEFLKSSIGYNQIQILKEAVSTAQENSKMNFKAYQYEMVEASELVQSHLMEVYVKAGYLKSVHDYLLSLATIDKLVSKKIDEDF